jgi:hypothetical protein
VLPGDTVLGVIEVIYGLPAASTEQLPKKIMPITNKKIIEKILIVLYINYARLL